MNRRSGTLVDDLVHHLRGRLLAGTYAAGERISESGVATEYGVARPTARTALDILSSDGLLERHPYAAFSVPTVDVADIAEILPLLEFVEAQAVTRIAELGPDLREVRDGAKLSLHHFLDVVVRAAGSPRLSRIHRQTTFELLMGSAQAGLAEPGLPGEMRSQMQTMVAALFDQDLPSARRALEALQAWRSSVLSAALEPHGA